jgi:hypothetical protein
MNKFEKLKQKILIWLLVKIYNSLKCVQGCVTSWSTYKKFKWYKWNVMIRFDNSLIPNRYTREELVKMLAIIRANEKEMHWIVPEMDENYISRLLEKD